MRRLALAGLLAFSLAGCQLGYDTAELVWPKAPDASNEKVDGGTEPTDASTEPEDAGGEPEDAGNWPTDGGTAPACSGCAAGDVCFFDGTAANCIPTIGSSNFVGVSGTSENDVWAVGSKSALHWNGVYWAAMPSPVDGSHFISSVLALGPTQVLVGAQDLEHWNGVIHEWNGQSWEKSYTPPSSKGVRALASVGADTFAVGSSGLLFELPDTIWAGSGGGEVTSDLLSVAASSRTAVFAGQVSRVNLWDGNNWSTAFSFSEPGETANGLSAAGGKMWVATSEGRVMRFDGAAWNQTAIPGTELRGIWARHDSEAWVVGSGGAFHRCYADPAPADIACSPSFLSWTGTLNAVWGFADPAGGGVSLFAVGDGGRVVHHHHQDSP